MARTSTFDGDHLTGGTLNDGGYAGSARYNKREARNDDVSLHVNWNATEQLRFEGDVQYSKASTKIIDLTMGPSAGPNFENAGPYILQLNGSNEPTIVIPANNVLTNPDTVYHNFAMDHHEDNDADAWAYRADADYTFDNSDWLDKIRFGVRYEDYNSTTRETGYRWGSISQNWAGGPAVFGAAERAVRRAELFQLVPWGLGAERVPVPGHAASSATTRRGRIRSSPCPPRRA